MLSSPTVTIVLPSGLNTPPRTPSVCPVRVVFERPRVGIPQLNGPIQPNGLRLPNFGTCHNVSIGTEPYYEPICILNEGVFEGPRVNIPQEERAIFTHCYDSVSIGTEPYAIAPMLGERVFELPRAGIPQPDCAIVTPDCEIGTRGCDSVAIETECYHISGEGVFERPRVGIPQPGRSQPNSHWR